MLINYINKCEFHIPCWPTIHYCIVDHFYWSEPDSFLKRDLEVLAAMRFLCRKLSLQCFWIIVTERGGGHLRRDRTCCSSCSPCRGWRSSSSWRTSWGRTSQETWKSGKIRIGAILLRGDNGLQVATSNRIHVKLCPAIIHLNGFNLICFNVLVIWSVSLEAR